MKKTPFRRVLSMLLAFVMLLSLAPRMQANATSAPTAVWKDTQQQQIALDRSDKLANLYVEDPFEPTEIVRVSIVLEEKSTLEAGFSTMDIANNYQAMAYNKNLKKNQEDIQRVIARDALDGQALDVVWNLTLVGNIISANVPYGKIALIEKIDGVAGVVLENEYMPNTVAAENGIVTNQFSASGMTGFSTVWSNGYTGAGTRIAVIDTGTDTDHQSFDNGAFLFALEQNALAEGLSTEEYMAGLNLLDEAELAAVLPYLNIHERDNTLTAEDLYLTEKLAFAVNYVDEGSGRLNVTHDNDYQSAHGSHVAGISTANRYIPSGNSYVDALSTVNVAGVAPDAQLITMKVFGNTALRDSDYMAAIEDAILLGCDSVNLSLGTTVPGYAFNNYYSELLEFMSNSDTVVVASAGNEGKWTEMTMFGRPYSDDVNYDTVGAPGSYTNFFTVASVENDGIVSEVFSVNGWNYTYTENTGFGNWDLADIDTSPTGSGTAYDYIFIDGLGYEADYAGMNLTGKVVFVSRGESSFYQKANTAVSLGAVAVIIYNNEPGGFGMDLSGYRYSAPCVSIPQEYSDQIRADSTQQTTADGTTYYTGQVMIYGRPQSASFNSEYYTMSEFSSWGVPGDLSIKPEITAPGGMIYSVYGSTPELFATDAYGLMSGTSMAAPQVSGMVALLAQYMQETGLAEVTGLSPRVLAQSLLMSTAVPMLEETSNSYYPVIQQGSGLARVDLATLATSYIMVAGQPDGKVKAEMGDDPQRTGVYEFSFVINNLTGNAQDYALSANLFRQGIYDPGEPAVGSPYGFTIQDHRTIPLDSNAFFSVSGKTLMNADVDYDLNGDGTTNDRDADFLLEYLLGNETELHTSGDVNGDGLVNSYDAHCLLALLSGNAVVTVPANGSVTVDVQLALTAEEKADLDARFPDGTFIQAYVFAEQVTEDGAVGTNHSIPVLAFYGNWTDPNMFDRGNYVEMWHGISDLVPYLYEAIGNGNALTIDYGDGNEYYFGGNPITQDDAYMAERNAFNSLDESYLKAQYFTLIRNAAATKLEIVDQQTGEVYFSHDTGDFYTAFFNSSYGVWENSQQGANLFWYGTDANGDPLPEGTVVEVRFTAAPEYNLKEDGTYDFDALGHGATLVTQMTIDNSAPVLNDYSLNPEDLTLTVNVQDNQYVSNVVLTNKTGSMVLASVAPNQTEANANMNIDLDLTGVVGEKFLLSVYDYALNVATYEIELDLPEIERPYFTAVDYNEGVYYGFDAEGNLLKLAGSDRGSTIQAVEYVDGHVFEVTAGAYLFVADDNDLNSFQFIGELDPTGEWSITNFLDLAYNYADGQLYGMFYSELNSESQPFIATINMYTGELDVLLEMPLDVCNMAIDGEGNFYSVAYDYPSLYRYTIEEAMNGLVNYIGEISYYGTGTFNSLCWDHNTDKLYWMYPNTLLEVNPETAEPTWLCYFFYNMMIGLHIRPTDTTRVGMFDPIDEVWSLELDYTSNRVMVGDTVTLAATARPWNTTDGSVTWSSADESIATVNENGVITGVSVGTTVITATSNLDPTMTASCVIDVMTLEKTLNGLVWDVDGKIWWSEFDITGLPNYTKIHDEAVPEYLASLAFTPDGTLYASSTDLSTGFLSSSLFTVDPDTFEVTKIGDSEYGYSDIAYAPNLRGGSIMGTYGSSLMVVNPSTGELYGESSYYQMFMYGLCAIAYAGSDRYQDYGFDTYIDWFFLIDTMGYVYLLGFLADEYGGLYYLDHPATNGGLFTIVNYTSDSIHFSSAHFDGEFLYWSVYNEAKDVSTLIAIDTVGSRNAYVMGDFGPGVWPAGGLCELDNPTAGMAGLNNYTMTLEPKAVETGKKLEKLSVAEPAAPAEAVSKLPALNLLSTSQPHPEDENWVVVEVTTSDIATNGTMQVTYDPAAMTLLDINSSRTAFATRVENGVVTIAFAEAAALAADTVVATLVFEVVEDGEHTVTVKHDELNNGTSDLVEEVTLGGTAPEFILGDVNGDGKVDTTDAKLIMQYDLKLVGDSDLELSVADVNGDGKVDTTDAKLIMQLDLGLITEFPTAG